MRKYRQEKQQNTDKQSPKKKGTKGDIVQGNVKNNPIMTISDNI